MSVKSYRNNYFIASAVALTGLTVSFLALKRILKNREKAEAERAKAAHSADNQIQFTKNLNNHNKNNNMYDAILLDIEGTTTPISFVKQKLFSFARNNLNNYIRSTFNDESTKEDILNIINYSITQPNIADPPIPNPYSTDSDNDKDKFQLFIEPFTKYVYSLIDKDIKCAPLKDLQGHMWKLGYEKGELLGEMFDDVPKNLNKWIELGLKVYIYSSGSVAAQKLIFGYTDHGDLTKYLSGYFDTRSGQKQDPNSYNNIIKELQLTPSRVLFLTDVYGEALAAHKSGLKTFLVLRDGNPKQVSTEDFIPQSITSFDQIQIENNQTNTNLDSNAPTSISHINHGADGVKGGFFD